MPHFFMKVSLTATDVWIILALLLTLLLQVFLCLKVKKLWIRLIPTAILFVSTVVFTVLLFLSEGWDALGYLLLALFAALFLGASVLGWLTYAIVKAVRTRRNKR